MQRWQYQVVNIGSFSAADRLVGALSELGAEGWELVTIYDKASNWLNGFEKGFALFKRPVAEGEDPVGPWASTFSLASGGRSGGASAVAAVNMLNTELHKRGIAVPGVAEALAAYVHLPIDGAIRVQKGDGDGVMIVAGTHAAIYWPNRNEVEQLQLRDVEKLERDGDRLRLRSGADDELLVLPRDAAAATGFAAYLKRLGVGDSR
jgi:hypothetical protein